MLVRCFLIGRRKQQHIIVYYHFPYWTNWLLGLGELLHDCKFLLNQDKRVEALFRRNVTYKSFDVSSDSHSIQNSDLIKETIMRSSGILSQSRSYKTNVARARQWIRHTAYSEYESWLRHLKHIKWKKGFVICCCCFLWNSWRTF